MKITFSLIAAVTSAKLNCLSGTINLCSGRRIDQCMETSVNWSWQTPLAITLAFALNAPS